MRAPKQWPLQSAGPSFPVAPLTDPLLRIIAGDPRTAQSPVEWHSPISKTCAVSPLQLHVRLGDAQVTIRLAPCQSADPIPSVWLDFTIPNPTNSANSATNPASFLTCTVSESEPRASAAATVCTAVFAPADFASGHGVVTRPLVGRTADPVATLRLTFLRVLPHPLASRLAGPKRRYVPALCGHRGMGASGPAAPWRVVENTLESFLLAANTLSSVKAVELDVQLTADHRAIVFHNWHFRPCNAKGVTVYDEHAVRIPLYNLTFAQFDKLYRQSYANAGPKVSLMRSGLRSSAIQRGVSPDAFTVRARSLLDVCDALPKDIGMLVELKYPDPKMKESLPYPEKNVFVDIVIDELLASLETRDRKIAFLCFEADICAMLALKQNVFPVYLSHCETLDGPCEMLDPRCTDLNVGFDFVKANGLDGMMLFNELTFVRPETIARIVQEKYPIITYGARNVDAVFVQKQLDMGVSGVIADDIHSLLKEMQIINQMPFTAFSFSNRVDH